MSVDSKIVNALTPLGYPVEVSPYTGRDSTYFVFNYDTIPADFGDDNPNCERYLVQVHLFAPLGNFPLSIVKQTKKALNDAGFIFPSALNLTDENGRHFCFECETIEGF